MRLAPSIKPYDFAKRSYFFSGEMLLNDHQQKLGNPAKDSHIHTEFQMHLQNETPTINGAIDGNVSLVCQRCLQPINVQILHKFSAALLRQGDELDETINDDIDVIYYEDALDSMDFLTNELLLAIPIAPKHDDCNMAHYKHDNASLKDEPNQAFTILNTLKQGDI